jgi:hypothetical protein
MKQVTPVDVLRRMKALLRKGWTQGWYARTAQGNYCRTDSKNAATFCLVGAHDRARRDLSGPVSLHYLMKCVGGDNSNIVGFDNIVDFNDNSKRTKKEILQVVDCAIKLAKEEK